jgi:hypothetical protein
MRAINVRTVLASFGALVIPAFPCFAQLATASLAASDSFYYSHPITELSFAPAYFGAFPPSNPPVLVKLFENRQFTASDVGKTFSADFSDDANFGSFVAKLTDGVNDYAGWAGAIGPYPDVKYYGMEGFGLWKFAPGIQGPDLHGYSIGRVDYTIDALRFDSVEVPPFGPNAWTFIDSETFNVTIAVYEAPQLSPVPEPTTIGAGLASVAFVAASLFLRRHKATWGEPDGVTS